MQIKSIAGDIQPVFIKTARRNLYRSAGVVGYPIQNAEKELIRLVSIFIFLIVIGLGGFLWAAINPLSMAQVVTQPGIIFLILLTWLPFFTALAFLEHWRQFPVWLLISIFCLFVQLMPGDAHEIRLLDVKDHRIDAVKQVVRPSVFEAMSAWSVANPAKNGEAVPYDQNRFKIRGQAITASDFLTPAIAALGYQDALYWILPVKISVDRAVVIEWAWENAWRDVAEPKAQDYDSSLFAQPYMKFGPNKSQASCKPALVFNGTSVGTGSRIIASHIRFDGRSVKAFDVFGMLPDAADWRIRLSTAVNISARFPYVLPAGPLGGSDGCKDSVCDRIVDGGYFENFGATTAEEILQVILAGATLEISNDGNRPSWLLADKKTRIYPIVVQISSDPGFVSDREMPKIPELHDSRFWTEIVSPPKTLLNTRSARGEIAMQALQRRASDMRAPFIHFNLRGDGKADVIPLSWSLSNAAQRAINTRLCDAYNMTKLEMLERAMESPGLAASVCPS